MFDQLIYEKRKVSIYLHENLSIQTGIIEAFLAPFGIIKMAEEGNIIPVKMILKIEILNEYADDRIGRNMHYNILQAPADFNRAIRSKKSVEVWQLDECIYIGLIEKYAVDFVVVSEIIFMKYYYEFKLHRDYC